MPFGTLYSYPANPRTVSLLAVAKENGLDLEQVTVEPEKGLSDDYLKLNPLGKVPTFEGSDGYVLTECIAIAVYLTAQNEKTVLLGKTKQDYASILKWMSFANSEILPALGNWFRPLIGRDAYNKKNVDTASAKTLKIVSVMEKHLVHNTFLVGERLSLADIFTVFDKEFRNKYPNTTRWYELVGNQDIYSSVAGKQQFIEEAVKYAPPKKEPKKEGPKAAVKKPEPKEKGEQEEEEEAPAAPKAKHPLEALGKPVLVLDDWKRKYSNEDTLTKAIPWFWENYKPEEYSLWRVDYKYNDELTMTFMSSNLIGGFFARLEASRKYLMGSMAVYGKNNDSVITGAFVVRGQEAAPAFDVAPDWESYKFTKLEPAKPEDKKFFEEVLAWEAPAVIDGKTYEFADGKVFK